VAVLVETSGGPQERSLKRERVDELELLPDYDSARGLFLLLDGEVAVVEVEELGVLVEKQGEDAFLKAVGPLIRAAIHEQILAPRVAVNVTVKQDISAL
jgi:hypothetical protein